MANFKKGQKVVCISESRGITVGRIYTIAGFDDCEFCNDNFVLIQGVNSGSRKECFCGNVPILPTNCFKETRFKPLLENKNKKALEEKIFDYDLVNTKL
jgi:hypothetical protein